jgi:ABC-type multidrug transport system ATPase subunit
VVVDSEEKLHAICFKDTDSACDAAVTFYDSPETMSQNRTWQYTIRADKRGTSNAEYLSHSGQTESLYMPLQLAINNAITNASAIPEVFMFSTSKDSNDNMRRQDAAAMIGSIYTFALFGCFFVMIYKFTTWVTTERESGMARLVDSMGNQWCLPARILSWILVIDLICLPLFLVFGLLYWKLAFPLSDALPLIGWQVVLGLAVNSSAAFAATFFRKARVSAIYVTAMFIILSLATQLFMVRTQPEPIPPVIWALASIFPSSNHALFTKQMATWQGANMKAEFSGFPGSRSADPDLHVVTQNSSLLILAGQFVVYALLAMVSEWAFHGPSSRRRHFGTEQCQTNEPSVQVEGLRMVFKPGFWTRLCCCGRRDTVTAIRNVHLQGHKSQILCLAGPNGSGKTTTLHAMAGFIRPTSGRVSMNARREQIGICPQQNTLWDDLTVCEHVQIWSQIKGGQESQVQINELIAACDLTIKRNSLAKTLSGGQKRKLQLACMFVGGSTVCLIDECTSGLDPLSRRVIWDLLLKYRTGRSIIFTTHFLDEVDVLADHTVILSAGTVRCQGSPAELYSRYGKGYKVSIPKDAAQTVIDGPWQTRHHQGKLVYTVPDSRSAAQLAKRFVTNGLSDVAISGPQFEDVFLKVTGEAEYSTNTLDSQQPFDLSPGETTSFLSQLAILLGKRFLVLPKLWWPYFFAVLLPVAVTPALLLIVSEYQPAQCAHWKPAIGAPQMRSFLYTTTCSETGYCAKMVIAPDEAKTELRSIVEKRFDDVREVNLTLFDEFTIPLDSRETWLDYIRSHRDTGSYSGIYTGSGNNAPIIAYRPESSAFTSGFELLSLWSQMSSGVQIKAQHAVLRDMPNVCP